MKQEESKSRDQKRNSEEENYFASDQSEVKESQSLNEIAKEGSKSERHEGKTYLTKLMT